MCFSKVIFAKLIKYLINVRFLEALVLKKDIDACFFKKKPALYLCLTTQNRAGYINNKNL